MRYLVSAHDLIRLEDALQSSPPPETPARPFLIDVAALATFSHDIDRAAAVMAALLRDPWLGVSLDTAPPDR